MVESPPLSSGHFTRLDSAYRVVGDATWATQDFLEENLAVSRNLFTPESLLARQPRPKELDVVALLGGLPFPTDFVEALVKTQREICAILGERLHYWVAPANLGLEFCVFKWPSDPWNDEWLGVLQDVLASLREPSFRFHVRGVQVNPDGCVIAKGFDENAVLFRIREQVRAEVSFLPAKQSGWAHVPLGRILEPVGADRFAELYRYIQSRNHSAIATAEIDSMKVVRETRWYMEARTTLAEYALR
jgi:hypothetical protein